MLIQGSTKTERTQRLTEIYTNLLDGGVEAEKILVLVQNPYKKSVFQETVRKNLKITAQAAEKRGKFRQEFPSLPGLRQRPA